MYYSTYSTIYIYTIYIYTYMHSMLTYSRCIRQNNTHTWTYVNIYVSVCVCMCVYMCVCLCDICHPRGSCHRHTT